MGTGRRPSFASEFPPGAALDELVDAFARGDYARVRIEAPRIALAADDATRRAAQILVDRTRPDPLAVVLLALTALLLVVLAAWWIAFAKPPVANGPVNRPVRSTREFP